MRLARPVLRSRSAWLLSACLLAGRTLVGADPGVPAVPAKDILATEKPLYSQSQEEVIIRDFFHDRRGGFFLDVGCAWPIKDSNTYYLEEHLGWSGIGVDALPEFAEGWKKKRPRSRFFNYLVSDHTDTVEPFYRSQQKGTSSALAENAKGPRGKAKAEQIQVLTTTLTTLLDKSGVKKIDFMNMDIEGFEPLALAGFDIDRFKPELACVEAKPANRETIMKYFADHGYERIERYLDYDRTNYYFTPKAAPR